MSTPTFIPDVFVDVTREQYLAWLAAGKPTTGPAALPTGAIPINASALNRLGVSLGILSETVAGMTGAPGAVTFTQSTPSASWVISHALGRFPLVDVYVAGVQVDADIAVTTTSVSVVFPTATAGVAVLA